MNRLFNFLGALRAEIRYATKAFWGVIGGFDELQHKTDGGWEWVGRDEFPDDPYYVCPLFYNGKHIPLPFFTVAHTEIGRLQLLAIRAAAKINPRSYEAAEMACAYYERGYDKLRE